MEKGGERGERGEAGRRGGGEGEEKRVVKDTIASAVHQEQRVLGSILSMLNRTLVRWTLNEKIRRE